MSGVLKCTSCRRPVRADAEAEAVICGRCCALQQNYLDNKVLTPANGRKARESAGLSPLALARMLNRGCGGDARITPAQIKGFESGARGCPAPLVQFIYDWYFSGGGA